MIVKKKRAIVFSLYLSCVYRTEYEFFDGRISNRQMIAILLGLTSLRFCCFDFLIVYWIVILSQTKKQQAFYIFA